MKTCDPPSRFNHAGFSGSMMICPGKGTADGKTGVRSHPVAKIKIMAGTQVVHCAAALLKYVGLLNATGAYSESTQHQTVPKRPVMWLSFAVQRRAPGAEDLSNLSGRAAL